MENLEIDVKGWPEKHVRLVKKYAEQLGRDLEGNDLANVPGEDRDALVERGLIRRGTQQLPEQIKEAPVGEVPSGVLEALLREREDGR